MRPHLSALVAVAVAVAGLAAACTGPPGHGHRPTTTTTVPVTIPVDGWAITGVTANQFCAGPTRPGGCQAPFVPTSDHIIVTRPGDHIPGSLVAPVAVLDSGPDGRFRVAVPPGSYSVNVSTSVMGASSDCESKDVTVAGPPKPTDVGTLHCTIQAP